MLTLLLLTVAGGLASSIGIVILTTRWAQKRNVLDHPNERSLHLQPTPRGGGVGVVLPLSLVLAGVACFVPESRVSAAWIGGTGAIIAAAGLADDVWGLSAVTRLAIYGATAILFAINAGVWRNVAWPGIGSIDLMWLSVPLTVVLIVSLTNAYNFMDGIDGIAGTQSAIAGLGWIGIGCSLQEPLFCVTGAVIASSSLGFLLFNWPPARVFMGDVGSAYLGFTFAALAVLAASRAPEAATAGILFVWPFVFDTSLTFLRRMARRENLLRAHRTHLYQRLVLTGVPQRTVTLIYGSLALVGAGVGMAALRGESVASRAGVVLIGVLAGGLWLAVNRREQSAVARVRPIEEVGRR